MLRQRNLAAHNVTCPYCSNTSHNKRHNTMEIKSGSLVSTVYFAVQGRRDRAGLGSAYLLSQGCGSSSDARECGAVRVAYQCGHIFPGTEQKLSTRKRRSIIKPFSTSKTVSVIGTLTDTVQLYLSLTTGSPVLAAYEIQVVPPMTTAWDLK